MSLANFAQEIDQILLVSIPDFRKNNFQRRANHEDVDEPQSASRLDRFVTLAFRLSRVDLCIGKCIPFDDIESVNEQQAAYYRQVADVVEAHDGHLPASILEIDGFDFRNVLFG